ncbi:MAG: hypothetical protein COW30_07435 [Rhodospirillales bacterium CG15_BIG_FIL_POST_REV_8_21_14_020_66_15]|nr:MAG: hypothetical protein COW30_07435 [Rhodospirillales bacterium CG15_BIG_FIL_POST_REV_8_21_14_020_66_15]
MAGEAEDAEWRTSIAILKDMAHHCADLRPDVKHMIEQAWLASQQGQEATARELLERARQKIES